jgi:neutral ceramidase
VEVATIARVISRRDFLVRATALAASTAHGAAAEQATWHAGVASADITPQPGIWMAGFAARTAPATGTALPLRAKALALTYDKRRMVLVTADLLGVTAAMRYRIGARLAQSEGLGLESWMLAASHTHCGPVVDDQLSVAYDLDPSQRTRIREYTTQVESVIVRLVRDALKALRPAGLAYAQGRATFGRNRRVQFLPPGPVDDAVPVLRVLDADGRPLAVVFGYACHNTTLPAAITEFHGDYAGVAQREIERRHPGAQAMFLAGCGADVNPAPRGTLALVEQHGTALAGEVDIALQHVRPIDVGSVGGPSLGLSSVDLPFSAVPDRAGWQARQQSDDVYVRRHAALMLDRLARDGVLERAHVEPIQVWRLGQLTLVALGGEVVIDYALRLKREHASTPLWVAGYTNDVSCYIPSGRVLEEGGYEGGGAMIYYGRPGPFDTSVEERIVTVAGQLMRRLGAS